jgi:Bacterial Ig-like domain (group 3)/FG-GAP-like repeat
MRSMLARRVLSFLATVAVCCELCLPFAVAQSAPGVSLGIKPITFQIPSQGQTKSRELRQGPVTPGELALKAAQQNVSKSHPFVSRSLSSGNSIFLAALDYNSAGEDTRSVAAADLNNDGSVDLVTADECNSSNCTGGSVSVLLGNGDGTFQSAVSYSSGGEDAHAVVIGDVNGDGRPDVVVVNNCNSNSNCSNGSVSVLLGNGDGTFQSAVSYGSGGLDATSVAIADVNGDAKADVVVANNCVDNNCLNGSVSVLLGNGDGTFQPAVSYNSGGQEATYVAVGDLNGDGKLDLAVTNQCASNSNCSNGAVSVLLGKGDGTFNSAVNYSVTGQYSNSIAIGDVNGDGHPDLTVSSECNSNQCSTGSLSVLLGNGDGTFQAGVDYASGGEYAMAIALTDINGDGKLDLLVANEIDSNGNFRDGSVASVLLGNGDGTFQPAFSYGSGAVEGISIAFADVNGDGKPDLILANACANSSNCTTGAVSVLLGNGDGTLRGGVDYTSNAWASYSVAIADVNGDGKLDLLLANECASNASCSNGAASVLLGNGDGTFQPGITYNSGGQDAFAIATADVNGDGKLDLLIVNECANNCSNGSVSVLLGNGDGTFQPAVPYGSGGLYSYTLAVGDVNGDGKPDLIISNQCNDNNCSNGSVSVLLGNGDGTFQAAVPYSSGAIDAFSVATADVNGDGKLDLVVANQCLSNNSCTNGVIGVLLGNGDGTFQPAVTYGSGGLHSYAVAIGDVSGDGHPDLVVSNQCGNSNSCTTGSIGVLLGNGDGTFQTATTTTTPVIGSLQTLVLADFNGDHKLDVATGAGNTLLLGNGDGTFQSPIALGASGAGMAVGDLNGDGRPDLAVGGVVVLLNISGGFVFPTTTTVASTVNPSAFGESVSFTATVAAQNSGTPTGTVTFSDGSTTVGQATVNAGTATYSSASLATGSHSITATYSGDSNFTGSASTGLSQVVQKVNTTTALNAPNSANVNQSVALTATVTPGTSGVPTGTVSFLDGTTQIGSASPNGSGVATFSTSTLAMGTHNITAVYGGDSNFNGSTSAAASVVVTNSGFSLSSSVLSPASVAPGGSGQSTITITPAGGLNPSTVNLSCSVSPVVSPAVTCLSGTISVTGGTGTATLTVSTTGPHAALAPPAERGSSKLIALALLIPGLFFCGTGLNSPKRRKLLAIGFVFLMLTGCVFETACTGVSSPSKATAGTPAGTYTVTVTGSATGMPHQTASVALTVQ